MWKLEFQNCMMNFLQAKQFSTLPFRRLNSCLPAFKALISRCLAYVDIVHTCHKHKLFPPLGWIRLISFSSAIIPRYLTIVWSGITETTYSHYKHNTDGKQDLYWYRFLLFRKSSSLKRQSSFPCYSGLGTGRFRHHHSNTCLVIVSTKS